MKKIRFIHGADLHLDSPFQGLRDLPAKLFQRVKDSTFDALGQLITHAINHKVDFVILAGDLFDGENRSLKAQVRLREGMEQLHKHGICCYIIHGNHDHLQGNWAPISWPRNVYFFKDEVHFYEFRKGEIKVNLYGYSYPKKSVMENIAQTYEKQGNADFHIGILHGTALGQEGHDRYAPFSIEQLLQKEFNYWALGHIHKRQILHTSPPIVYSGNIQGRHIKETGKKGIYLVELDFDNNCELTFLKTNQIRWEEVTVWIDDILDVDELKYRSETAILEARGDNDSLLVQLRFKGSGPLHSFLLEEINDFIELLNSSQGEKVEFTYIIDSKLETIGQWDRESLKKEEYLVSDIICVVDRFMELDEPLQNVLREIYGNVKLKRFLHSFSSEEQKEILIEAERYLLTTLIKERDE